MTAQESSNALRRSVVRRLSEATATLPLSSLRRLQYVSDIAARSGFRRLVRFLPTRGSWTKADQRAVEGVAVALGRLKGVPMKLGQLASYVDSSVPAALRPAFAALEANAQALPYHRIEAALRSALGDRASDLLETFESKPVAVASIGQVHRAQVDGQPVAVKIRYPGIEQAIRLDFRPAAFGTWATMGVSGEHGELLVRQMLQHILAECDYAREAERQNTFAKCFEEHPVIRVPKVYADYSNDAVITMQFAEGLPLEAFLATHPSPEARARASAALLDFYVGSIFLLGTYNSDPHPGNYLFGLDGRIDFIDHGSGRTFTSDVGSIKTLARAVLEDDRSSVRAALDTLGILAADRRIDERPLMHVLRWLLGPLGSTEPTRMTVPEAEEVQQLVRCIRDFPGFAYPGELMFLIRLRIALCAALAQLGAKMRWRDVLDAHLDGHCFLMPPRFDVVLVEPGPRPIELLRALRDELGGAVTEAKAMLDAAPCIVTSNVKKKTAQVVIDRLQAAGARMKMRPMPDGG